jgi:hypothetical protein
MSSSRETHDLRGDVPKRLRACEEEHEAFATAKVLIA